MLDDSELIERMCAGDAEALAQFYDRWARPAYALIVQMVRDPDDADDVLEDAFYQAWRQASRYEPGRGSVATWILTIARSRALDRLRSRRRLREEPLAPGADDMIADRAERVMDVAEVAEQRERVAEAVRTLPPEQREVVELAYFRGLSQAEIAERTGQPLGTVKTRTRLAGQKLRERLAVLREGEGEVR
ncbi:MAG TPA: sigma-70 family RNA polymerase sigma factor [Gemmatimonadaceae bacterium]|nr:sigma-70 family RNA polymerase sigma factor [Gemmatimonadaceae bacterium]